MRGTKIFALTAALFMIPLSSCSSAERDKKSIDSNVNWSLFEDKKRDDFFNYSQKTGFKIIYTQNGEDAEYYGAIKGKVIWRHIKSNIDSAYFLDENDQKTYAYQLSNEQIIGDNKATYEADVFEKGAFDSAFSVLFKAKEISKYEGFIFVQKSTYLDRSVDIYKYVQEVETVVITSTFYVEEEFGLTLWYEKKQLKADGSTETISETKVKTIMLGDEVVPPSRPNF